MLRLQLIARLNKSFDFSPFYCSMTFRLMTGLNVFYEGMNEANEWFRLIANCFEEFNSIVFKMFKSTF